MRRYMTAPNASTAENTALTRYQYALDVCRTARGHVVTRQRRSARAASEPARR